MSKINKNLNSVSRYFVEISPNSLPTDSGPKNSWTKLFQLETNETDFGSGGDPVKCPTEKPLYLIQNTCYQIQEVEVEHRVYQTHHELQAVLVFNKKEGNLPNQSFIQHQKKKSQSWLLQP